MDQPTSPDRGSRESFDARLLAPLLARAPSFRNVPASEIEAITPGFRARAIAVGEVVVHQGDDGDEMFLVEEGDLEATVELQGRRVRLGLLRPGDVFGEMTLLRGTPRSATVTALRPARLWSLTRATLRAATTLTPVLEANLREVMRRRDLANALRALQ